MRTYLIGSNIRQPKVWVMAIEVATPKGVVGGSQAGDSLVCGEIGVEQTQCVGMVTIDIEAKDCNLAQTSPYLDGYHVPGAGDRDLHPAVGVHQ